MPTFLLVVIKYLYGKNKQKETKKKSINIIMCFSIDLRCVCKGSIYDCGYFICK